MNNKRVEEIRRLVGAALEPGDEDQAPPKEGQTIINVSIHVDGKSARSQVRRGHRKRGEDAADE